MPARPPWLAWAWLGCGALALTFAVDDWLTLDAARSEARSQLQRIPTLPRTTITAAPRGGGGGDAAAARIASRGEEAAAQATARDIARRLDHPWSSLFEDTELAAAPGVHWLRLEHDAERGDVRLDAIAPGRDAVLATLEALSSASAWRDVMLLRVDTTETSVRPSGALRFEFRARHGMAPQARADTP